VQNLTRTLAMEWAPHGILVNCIAPGPIDTPRRHAQLGHARDEEAGRGVDRAEPARPVEEIAWPASSSRRKRAAS
jgi:NAD(P)-dependent dehydrogenase (short-subunit alcohol dehydrogenase family)